MKLKQGLDFRLPEYRREVFLNFYEFHLKYGTNPGCIYFLFPYLVDRFKLDDEEKLWLAFLNGNTQNPVMTWLIFNQFPDLKSLDIEKLDSWFNENWSNLSWDTDRRHQKRDFITSVKTYHQLTAGHQLAYFRQRCNSMDEYVNFENVWKDIRNDFYGFGRLSAFSYSEYLRIMGLSLDCNNLFLEDMSGSASHRNGLAIVLGRDDLDFKHEKPTYKEGELPWLKHQAAALLGEAKTRFKGKEFEHDVSYFTLESVLCTYKSWHRPNRRYPNVYSDMLHDRIKWAEQHWPKEDFELFWEARLECLPEYLLQECMPNDPGLSKEKQNHYRLTGEVIMMSRDFSVYDNAFDRRIWGAHRNNL